jgi:formylmethanofuran dehydrogenase subunit E
MLNSDIQMTNKILKRKPGKSIRWPASRWIGMFGLFLVCGSILWAASSPIAPDSRPKIVEDGPFPPSLNTTPFAPKFQVLDTESSLGPYVRVPKTITLDDLVKMHGHACDGLVTAGCALSVGLKYLYPTGVVDRTDTACITNNSPCFGDVAAYLTGGRIRFGTQKIDPKMKNEFILYRISTGKAVKVSLNHGVFPNDVLALEKKIRGGHFTAEEMRQCQKKQWDYAQALLHRPLSESFTVEAIHGFRWQPDAYEHLGPRGDTMNKNVGNNS